MENELRVWRLLRVEGLKEDLSPFCGLWGPSANLCSAIDSNNIIADGAWAIIEGRP